MTTYLKKLFGDRRPVYSFYIIDDGRFGGCSNVHKFLSQFLKGEPDRRIVDGVFTDNVSNLGVLLASIA